jgi:hypothetical protein
MKRLFKNLDKSVAHIKALTYFFVKSGSYDLPKDEKDKKLYRENFNELKGVLSSLGFESELYNQKTRQMILGDLFEYIFLGRGFYSIGKDRKSAAKKESFVRAVLHFVNLLMCFETITVEADRRTRLVNYLAENVDGLENEDNFSGLRDYTGSVGTPSSQAAGSELNDYFDKLLPKTAGGMWHELLVYIFILRHNLGYVLPLLLHQKIYSKTDHLVPPDFLVITKDKRMFGIEVGRKKEIQSGAFSLKTAIPTASLDTENSRNSDRCPICQKWILFCPVVIEKFSDFSDDINRTELKCLNSCTKFGTEEIVNGVCPYSKYARGRTLQSHTQHPYSDGKHYHYQCVLEKVDPLKSEEIIRAKDRTAIKTHLPHYSGLESLAVN